MVEERGAWDAAGRHLPEVAENNRPARSPWVLAALAFGVLLVLCAGALAFFALRSRKLDFNGGAEVIYSLDYGQVDSQIASQTRQLNAARTKDPASHQVRELTAMVAALEQSRQAASQKAVEVVQKLLDAAGMKGLPVSVLPGDKPRLRILRPRMSEAESARFRGVIENLGRLTCHLVNDDPKVVEETTKSPTKRYKDADTGVEYELRTIKKPKRFSETGEYTEEQVVIQCVPGVDGSQVAGAMARHAAESASWEIGVRFTPAGQVQFSNLTAANVRKRLAIALDGVVYSAPVIQEPIYGECRISGDFTRDEAERLARVVSAGALPVELKYESETSIGAAQR